jgi:hypothetical protein
MVVPVGGRCNVIGCDNLAAVGNLCGKHYKRKQRHGDVNHRKHADGGDFGKASDHPLYTVWRGITRIGRGLEVCDQWKTFSIFAADVVQRPTGSCHFKRINSKGLFEPGNVFWSEYKSSDEDRLRRAEAMRQYTRSKVKDNPDYFWNAGLKKSYGVTAEWYTSTSAEQGGTCAICKKPETAVVRGRQLRLSVDHCHTSGKVRGLLCSVCNRAIGALRDDVSLLQSAINYLKQHGA